VALFSDTHLKPYERFYISNSHLYRTDRFPGRKGETAVAVRKGIPHSHADLPLLVSIEATGICIRIENTELLLAAIYKPQAAPGMTQTPLSSQTLDVRQLSQEI
jgi:hypothetical protein